MGWRDDLLEASFRGVPFEVQAGGLEGGRRKVVIEGPGRDVPFVQDLGRKARRVTLFAFVVGDDYLGRRDALINALEKPGSGELVHPTYGRETADVLEFRVSESTREGGLARVSITLVLRGVSKDIVTGPSPVARVEEASEGVRGAAYEDVATAVVPSSSSYDRAAARQEARDASTVLAEVVEGNRRSISLEIGEEEGATLLRQSLDLADSVLEEGADFVAWLQDFQNAGLGLSNAISRRREGFRLLLSAVRSILGLGGDASRARVRYTSAGSLLAIAGQAGAEVGGQWESRTDALAGRDEFLELADDVLEGAPDKVAGSVADLRSAVIDAIPPPNVTLPVITTYTPADEEPALVAAARIYGSPELSDDIARRNGVRNPAFLPAGQPLEVLVDV